MPLICSSVKFLAYWFFGLETLVSEVIFSNKKGFWIFVPSLEFHCRVRHVEFVCSIIIFPEFDFLETLRREMGILTAANVDNSVSLHERTEPKSAEKNTGLCKESKINYPHRIKMP